MEWISVESELPPEESPFLGTDGDVIFVAYWVRDCEKYKVGGWENCHYCGGASEVSFSEKNYTTKKVKFWMPLPNPPEGA